VTRYQLDDMHSIPSGGNTFLSAPLCQDNLCETHPASYSKEGKVSRGMIIPTHIHILKARNAWSYTFTPSHIFKAWFLNKCRENLNFTTQYTRITLSKIMNWKLNSKCLIP